MRVLLRLSPMLAAALLLAGCKDDYSPDTYATRAVQQANRVEQGTLIGVRRVTIRPDGSTGAAAGATAGGVIGGAGAAPTSGIGAALGAVGGALVGGIIGGTAERTTGETPATEYIVRKTNNELVSVTQRDERPLVLGMRVLVIGGNQARIVPDYTAQPPENPASMPAPPAGAAAASMPPAGSTAPPPGASAVPPPVIVPPPPMPTTANE